MYTIHVVNIWFKTYNISLKSFLLTACYLKLFLKTQNYHQLPQNRCYFRAFDPAHTSWLVRIDWRKTGIYRVSRKIMTGFEVIKWLLSSRKSGVMKNFTTVNKTCFSLVSTFCVSTRYTSNYEFNWKEMKLCWILSWICVMLGFRTSSNNNYVY